MLVLPPPNCEEIPITPGAVPPLVERDVQGVPALRAEVYITLDKTRDVVLLCDLRLTEASIGLDMTRSAISPCDLRRAEVSITLVLAKGGVSLSNLRLPEIPIILDTTRITLSLC